VHQNPPEAGGPAGNGPEQGSQNAEMNPLAEIKKIFFCLSFGIFGGIIVS
jgi:hypothetical protein